jgi:hypothetical protein
MLGERGSRKSELNELRAGSRCGLSFRSISTVSSQPERARSSSRSGLDICDGPLPWTGGGRVSTVVGVGAGFAAIDLIQDKPST